VIRRSGVVTLAYLVAVPIGLTAQLPAVGAPPRRAATEPSLAQQYLDVGRLFLAERELYAAVAAAPRQSAPRGELARYLASRGRFRIADVLLDEALRFGADPAIVARARAEMQPYRDPAEWAPVPGVRPPAAVAAREAERAATGHARNWDGTEATVPMQMTEDARTLLRFQARTARGAVWVTVDPRAEGVAIASAADTMFRVQRFGGEAAYEPVLLHELAIGARTLTWIDAVVDPSVRAGELRVGMDVFWQLRPVVDERAGTITLMPPGSSATVPERVRRIPFVLAFPGLLLVPRPGVPPVAVESDGGRALLRGARWWVDVEEGTVVVVR
jgi:hypothetical protein